MSSRAKKSPVGTRWRINGNGDDNSPRMAQGNSHGDSHSSSNVSVNSIEINSKMPATYANEFDLEGRALVDKRGRSFSTSSAPDLQLQSTSGRDIADLLEGKSGSR